MSSSSIVSSLAVTTQQMSIYFGTIVLVAGIIGGLLNIIVFLSLRTFRQNSCSFYLTIMSFANVGQLIAGLFSRIMITGFGIDWTHTSAFYCKFRIYILQVCGLVSVTCMCLAIVDQYLATCSGPRRQQWSNNKTVCRLCAISAVIVSLLHGIPFLVYYTLTVPLTTGQPICAASNTIFLQYFTYFYQMVLLSSLPMFITVLFGFLAYRNVQQLAHRTIPLVRRELDKQLTSMVLIEVVFNFFAIVPYLITILLLFQTSINGDIVVNAQIRFANSVTLYFYYMYYACPFYMYICISERFRRQLIYVIIHIYLRQWRRPIVIVNQVAPHM